MVDLLDTYIKRFSLAQHLRPELLRCLRLVRLPAQVELYSQADEQKQLYFLVEGKVQVNRLHPNGKLSVLAMMSPLALIGDLELFNDAEISANIVTLEASAFLAVEKTFVMRYGYDDPKFLRFIIQTLTSKLYQTSILQTGAVLTLISRFAIYLLEQKQTRITLPSKTDLAALLGTTPRHLNRILHTLSEDGAIKIEKRVLEIINVEKLQQYSK